MTIDQKTATHFLAKLDQLIRENTESHDVLVRETYALALIRARRSLSRRILRGEFPQHPGKGKAACTRSTH